MPLHPGPADLSELLTSFLKIIFPDDGNPGSNRRANAGSVYSLAGGNQPHGVGVAPHTFGGLAHADSHAFHVVGDGQDFIGIRCFDPGHRGALK